MAISHFFSSLRKKKKIYSTYSLQNEGVSRPLPLALPAARTEHVSPRLLGGSSRRRRGEPPRPGPCTAPRISTFLSFKYFQTISSFFISTRFKLIVCRKYPILFKGVRVISHTARKNGTKISCNPAEHGLSGRYMKPVNKIVRLC